MCHKTFRKWFHCISLCHSVNWNLKSLENVWNVVMDLKFHQGFIFYEPGKATLWLEKRLIKIEEQLKESVNYCLKQNISFLWKNGFVIPNIRPVCFRDVISKRRCQSRPQKGACHTEVSTIMCPLHRSFSMRVWPTFHLFPRKVSLI